MVCYYKAMQTSKSTVLYSAPQSLASPLPVPTPRSPPSSYSLGEHQQWGILPVPS